MFLFDFQFPDTQISFNLCSEWASFLIIWAIQYLWVRPSKLCLQLSIRWYWSLSSKLTLRSRYLSSWCSSLWSFPFWAWWSFSWHINSSTTLNPLQFSLANTLEIFPSLHILCNYWTRWCFPPAYTLQTVSTLHLVLLNFEGGKTSQSNIFTLEYGAFPPTYCLLINLILIWSFPSGIQY